MLWLQSLTKLYTRGILICTRHTDIGPIAVGLWYRPPSYAEVDSIESLAKEWKEQESRHIGTIILGDMNVHHQPWLQFSNGSSPEGQALFKFCVERGFIQRVHEPTRNKYLLDLVLTDLDDIVTAKVLPRISDHCPVLCRMGGDC